MGWTGELRQDIADRHLDWRRQVDLRDVGIWEGTHVDGRAEMTGPPKKAYSRRRARFSGGLNARQIEGRQAVGLARREGGCGRSRPAVPASRSG